MAPATRPAAALAVLLGATTPAAAAPPPPPATVAAPAPAAAASIAIAAGTGPAMLARLAGQRARLDGDRLVIDDIAGEGPPWIGVVERRGPALWLVGETFARRLTGPLARPRLAGPGYLVWVTGAPVGDTLVARRLGVLAAPQPRGSP